MYITSTVCLLLGIAWMVGVKLTDSPDLMMLWAALPFAVVLLESLDDIIWGHEETHFDKANFPSHFE